MIKKFFNIRQIRECPDVVFPTVDKATGRQSFGTQVIGGVFYLVFPSDAREVAAVQLADHNSQKFAPAHGDGILLSKSFMDLLDAR